MTTRSSNGRTNMSTLSKPKTSDSFIPMIWRVAYPPESFRILKDKDTNVKMQDF